ncbi:MAG: cytochrome c-type biogenesis protein CcmH [Chromatiales bacterium]|jgi:cytochrome c-type biogenesis protein CcmH
MKYFIFVLSLLLSSSSFARISTYEFDTPEQEAEYKSLISELRCLVCQNQNIADSNAELAQDLKRKTYEMVISGKSKQEVADYMTERYGDFVLYRPPLTSTTFFLWLGPFLILVVGLFFLMRVILSRRKQPDTELAAEDRARAEDLLKSDKN